MIIWMLCAVTVLLLAIAPLGVWYWQWENERDIARAKAEANKSMPFEMWSVENLLLKKLKEDGKLLEVKELTGTAAHSEDVDYGDDDDDSDVPDF